METVEVLMYYLFPERRLVDERDDDLGSRGSDSGISNRR